MVHSYGMSIKGTAHEKNGTPCQDSYKIVVLDNGWVVAAIADGVGSCKYSEISSAIAVDVSTSICSERIDACTKREELPEVIKDAFKGAELAIETKSTEDKNLITEYDTTLSLVIYDGKMVSYGHCGDGGVIGLTQQGDYVKITEPQKKDEVFVIPLRDGEPAWVFGLASNVFASVLMATDGVYDIFFPYLLKGRTVEFYVPLIRYFMDNNGLHVNADTCGKIKAEREQFLMSDTCSSVMDDKTVVVLINGNVYPKMKDDSFYAEPDWDYLQAEWNKKAYPHLFNK